MKLVFLGTPDFAVPTLQRLCDQGLAPVRGPTDGLKGQCLIADKIEAAAARRTLDLAHRVVVDNLHRVVAMWAADVQRLRLCR